MDDDEHIFIINDVFTTCLSLVFMRLTRIETSPKELKDGRVGSQATDSTEGTGDTVLQYGALAVISGGLTAMAVTVGLTEN